MKKLLALVALLLAAGCNYPSGPPVNELQTAIAATLDARPLSSATPGSTATADPDAAPSGRIVYVCQFSKLSSRNQICIMNADGSDQRVLTPSATYNNFFPSLAPDGASVVFSSDRTGRHQIYEMDLTGGALVQLTHYTNGEAFAAEISPDGQYIVYYYHGSGDYPASHSIWLMNRDGSNEQAIVERSGGGWDPVWSPDGTQILFAGQSGGIPQLFIVDADGGNLRQATDFDGIRGRNDWSPDGHTLSTYIGEPWDRDIYIFDLEGENLRQLTNGFNNLAPSFSPDGQWITFMSYRDHPRENLGCEIYIMRIDGSNAMRLTDNDICDWQPRWGP